MSFTKIMLVGVALAVSASGAMAKDKVKDPVPPVTWVLVNDPLHPSTSITVEGKAVTYGPAAAHQVYGYSTNPGSQGLGQVETMVETLFSLPSTGAGSLKLGDYGDISGKSGSFVVDTSFNYLAFHYGNGELVFHWDTAQAANTTFTFSGLPNGASNFRAFSTISAVPEPATYGMLLGGLALMGVVARRRARK
jgi:hypothetical protein